MFFLDHCQYLILKPLSADIIMQPSSRSANIHKTALKLRSALDHQVHSLITELCAENRSIYPSIIVVNPQIKTSVSVLVLPTNKGCMSY